jgi:hypothetical protein
MGIAFDAVLSQDRQKFKNNSTGISSRSAGRDLAAVHHAPSVQEQFLTSDPQATLSAGGCRTA